MGLRRREDRGFTLIETIIAILLLMIVMATLAPMFIGTFRATGVTNARSAATSLAVEASEQIRGYPYYEIGYYNSHQPAACAAASSLTQVTLDPSLVTSEPLYALATSATVNHIHYTVQRCVYWVDSTVTADTQAYKEAIVTVSWAGSGTTLHVTQTSSIYPGGEGGYSAQNDFVPGQASTHCNEGTPGTPSNVTAVDDSTTTQSSSNTIDVSWTASNPAADFYTLEYTSQGDPGNAPIHSAESSYSTSSETTATSMQLTVGASTQYWIQVYAVACGTLSSNSLTATATTTSGTTTTTTASSTTTTTVAGGSTTTSTSTTTTSTTTTIATCNLYGLSVVPTGASGNVTQVAIDSTGNNNGNMHDTSSYNTFSLTLSSSNTAYCSNVYVAYIPGGGTPTACTTGGSCKTEWTALSANGAGTFVGTATKASNEKWGTTGLSFVVYLGSGSTAIAYSPATATNVSTCSYSANSCP